MTQLSIVHEVVPAWRCTIATATLKQRLASLDAFRGLAIASMILVNNPGDWSHVYWPLKRYLQRELETRIGRAIAGGQVPDGARITVDVKGSELVVEIEQPAKPGAREEEPAVAGVALRRSSGETPFRHHQTRRSSGQSHL